jgi:hypothetical protein
MTPSSRDTAPLLRVVEVEFAEKLLSRRTEVLRAPRGALFGVVTSTRDVLIAVAIVGRPVPPARDDGRALEITRTWSNGTVTAEVAIYRSVWQLIRLRGYDQLITHTEMGAIRRGLAGLGVVPVAAVPPRAASHVPPRLRVGRGVDGASRVRWHAAPGRTAQPAAGYASTAAVIPLAEKPSALPGRTSSA